MSSDLLSLDDFVDIGASSSGPSPNESTKKVLRRAMTPVAEDGASASNCDEEPMTVSPSEVFPFEQTTERLWCREDIGSSGDAGIEVLTSEMEAGHMQDLEALELQWNQISAVGTVALARALSRGVLPKLRTLQLSGNEVGDFGVAALAGVMQKGLLEKLEVLDLESNKISGVGLNALQQALRKDVLRALRSLNVRGNDFDENSKMAMQEVMKERPTLRVYM